MTPTPPDVDVPLENQTRESLIALVKCFEKQAERDEERAEVEKNIRAANRKIADQLLKAADEIYRLHGALESAHKVFGKESDQMKKMLERDEKRRAALEEVVQATKNHREISIGKGLQFKTPEDGWNHRRAIKAAGDWLDITLRNLDALTPNQKDR